MKLIIALAVLALIFLYSCTSCSIDEEDDNEKCSHDGSENYIDFINNDNEYVYLYNTHKSRVISVKFNTHCIGSGGFNGPSYNISIPPSDKKLAYIASDKNCPKRGHATASVCSMYSTK